MHPEHHRTSLAEAAGAKTSAAIPPAGMDAAKKKRLLIVAGAVFALAVLALFLNPFGGGGEADEPGEGPATVSGGAAATGAGQSQTNPYQHPSNAPQTEETASTRHVAPGSK